MENYRKAAVLEQPCPCPFTDLPEGTPVVRVRDGSKIRNLMKFALSRMEGGTEKPSEDPVQDLDPAQNRSTGVCRQMVFSGVGPSVSKAVSCVEIMKRRVPELHQWTRLAFSTLQETWDPLEPTAGLDSITVSRNVPAIWVLLSRDELDRNTPGYQAPGNYQALWAQEVIREREGQKRKSGGRGGGGGGRGSRKQTPRPRDGGKGSGPSSRGR